MGVGDWAAPANRSRTRKSAKTATDIAVKPNGSLQPDPEDIARLAYSYWAARGQEGGTPEQDWFRAEASLKNQRVMAASAG
ncbi:MAG: DUF2934 domain-containing protein [Acidobacteriota bacterium]